MLVLKQLLGNFNAKSMRIVPPGTSELGFYQILLLRTQKI